jgi:hypothetical protein
MIEDVLSPTSGPLWRTMSGPPEMVIAEVNQVEPYYRVQSWNFSVIKDVLTLTVICLHVRGIREMMLAAQRAQNRGF